VEKLNALAQAGNRLARRGDERLWIEKDAVPNGAHGNGNREVAYDRKGLRYDGGGKYEQ
jgi:hypothetical protein